MRHASVLISLLVFLVFSSTSKDGVRGNKDNTFLPDDYAPSDTMYIYSDSYLATHGLSRDGSRETPYLIDNLSFDLNETLRYWTNNLDREHPLIHNH
ncbi:MAG: hypothetical protein ACW99G_17305 [Candidatus Thorarchaeota archaeon]|jgi:hypothetical protein